MRNTYPITEAQIAVLKTFTCQRLTDDDMNLHKIQNFLSYRGPGLVSHLRNFGWEADKSGSTAYYVIKNQLGQIVMFFSLKCGALFDPGYVKKFAEEFSETQHLWKMWNEARRGDLAAQQYLMELEGLLGKEQFRERIRNLESDYINRRGMLREIKADKRSEPSDKIIRVDKAHPAIELVEFCANDRTRGCWDTAFNDQFMTRRNTMGKVFFWWFIVPKMIEISRLIGCEYAYLFAADDDPDGDLVRYYEDALHFKKLTHLGTIKPYYDMNCYFMGRRLFSVDEEHLDPGESIEDEEDLRGLNYYRDMFFEHFNLRTDVHDMI